jgi:hypothetical protein
LAEVLVTGEWDTARVLMSARELSPSAIEWVAWNWQRGAGKTDSLVNDLRTMRNGVKDSVLAKNTGHVTAKLLNGYEPVEVLELYGQAFEGDMLRSGKYRNLHFVNCDVS